MLVKFFVGSHPCYKDFWRTYMKITSLIIIIIMKLFSWVLKNNGLIEKKKCHSIQHPWSLTPFPGCYKFCYEVTVFTMTSVWACTKYVTNVHEVSLALQLCKECILVMCHSLKCLYNFLLNVYDYVKKCCPKLIYSKKLLPLMKRS